MRNLGGHRQHSSWNDWVTFRMRKCSGHFVQFNLQPLGLALALVFETHNRWIMASQAGDKTKRRDRNRLGKKRVPCGPLLRTHRKDAPTDQIPSVHAKGGFSMNGSRRKRMNLWMLDPML